MTTTDATDTPKTTKDFEVESEDMDVGSEEKRNPFLALTRNVIMAGLGAMAMTQDTAEDFVNRLIERGEIAEKDGRKMLDEIRSQFRRQEAEAEAAGEDVLEEAEEALKEGQNVFAEATHKVLMAGIGAMALAQDEIEDFVNRLIERGEIAEKDGRKMLDDLMARRRKEGEKLEEALDQRIEKVLHEMNIPSKADIDALSAKITALTKKVDALNKT